MEKSKHSDSERSEERVVGGSDDTEEITCRHCLKEVKPNQDGIQCEFCELWFHAGCEKISSDYYKILTDGKNKIMWLCEGCQSEFKTMKNVNKAMREENCELGMGNPSLWNDIEVLEQKEDWLRVDLKKEIPEEMSNEINEKFEQEKRTCNGVVSSIEGLECDGHSPGDIQQSLMTSPPVVQPVDGKLTGMDSARMAGYYMKYFMFYLKESALKDMWVAVRTDFLLFIDADITDEKNYVMNLCIQLRLLEGYVNDDCKKETWREWQNILWDVMTNPEQHESCNVTQFVICLHLLEANLSSDALSVCWTEEKRQEWLTNTEKLVDARDQLIFHIHLLSLNGVLLQKYGHDSLDAYRSTSKDVVEHILSIAAKIDLTARNAGIAITTAGGTGIAAGITTGVGLILAPFTLGASIIVSGVGIGLGIASSATSLGSRIAKTKIEEKYRKQIENEIKRVIHTTLALSHLLERLNYSTESMGEDSPQFRLLLNSLEHSKEVINKALKVIGIVFNIVSSATIKETALITGSGTSILWRGGSTAARAVTTTIGGILSLASVGLGIWETIEGAHLISQKGDKAQSFREMAENLDIVIDNIVQACEVFNESEFLELTQVLLGEPHADL